MIDQSNNQSGLAVTDAQLLVSFFLRHGIDLTQEMTSTPDGGTEVKLSADGVLHGGAAGSVIRLGGEHGLQLHARFTSEGRCAALDILSLPSPDQIAA